MSLTGVRSAGSPPQPLKEAPNAQEVQNPTSSLRADFVAARRPPPAPPAVSAVSAVSAQTDTPAPCR